MTSSMRTVLDDDLLLDRVAHRLDGGDELGSMLLAFAHHVDTPLGAAAPRSRRALSRRRRGLTVLAALGVAVSGSTVAAAVESAPPPLAGDGHVRDLVPEGPPVLRGPRELGPPAQPQLVLADLSSAGLVAGATLVTPTSRGDAAGSGSMVTGPSALTLRDAGYASAPVPAPASRSLAGRSPTSPAATGATASARLVSWSAPGLRLGSTSRTDTGVPGTTAAPGIPGPQGALVPPTAGSGGPGSPVGESSPGGTGRPADDRGPAPSRWDGRGNGQAPRPQQVTRPSHGSPLAGSDVQTGAPLAAHGIGSGTGSGHGHGHPASHDAGAAAGPGNETGRGSGTRSRTSPRSGVAATPGGEPTGRAATTRTAHTHTAS